MKAKSSAAISGTRRGALYRGWASVAGDTLLAPAEQVFARAFNLWMYESVRHPERWSHEAGDVAAFRRQSAMGIEPHYGARASANLLQFLEQAQVAA